MEKRIEIYEPLRCQEASISEGKPISRIVSSTALMEKCIVIDQSLVI